MPTKSANHESAQRKVWLREIRSLEREAGMISTTNRRELKKAYRACQQLEKKLNSECQKLARLQRRIEKSEARQIQAIESRIAILRGRLGL